MVSNKTKNPQFYEKQNLHVMDFFYKSTDNIGISVDRICDHKIFIKCNMKAVCCKQERIILNSSFHSKQI